jgi:VWFA-related protein
MSIRPCVLVRVLICAGIASTGLLPGQTTSAPSAHSAEVVSKETPFTFKSGTNLVPVPVVVRDHAGHAVGNLSRDDFQLFDNGKPQMISKFSIERLAKDAQPATSSPAPKDTTTAAAPGATPPNGSALADATTDGIPDRFVAYLFDDLHMSLSDLVYTRDAAKRQIDTSLHDLDSAAIYTTSGSQMQEFTGDRAKLHAALDAITASHGTIEKSLQQNGCPQVSYYMADRIYNKNDMSAWVIAMDDVIVCANLSAAQVPSCVTAQSAPSDGPVTCVSVNFAISDMGQQMVRAASRAVILSGDRDTEATLATLRAVVARMTAMPGQRSIVLVSPGFRVLDDRRDEETGLVERAIKGNVVIGAIDARGLYTQIPGGDASERVSNSQTIAVKMPFVQMETMSQTDTIANLAYGTGGNFYHGTNDYDEGLARVAAQPEYIYVLGFSPLDLKLDGRYHNLKVTMKPASPNAKGMDLQARKGYYAPKYAANPADQAKQQIEEAFFSRDEIHDLAAALQTQYFKLDSGDATLSTVAKVDVKKLAFKKDGDRNRNDLTVVTGLFDNDGNFVGGSQKLVEMRLLDETLEKRVGQGIAVKSSFTVHPGRYVVRMVVRDSEGQAMAAQSSLVEIP